MKRLTRAVAARRRIAHHDLQDAVICLQPTKNAAPSEEIEDREKLREMVEGLA